jgi:large subunit ribosomal protein L38
VEANLDEIKSDWLKTAGPFHIRKIADHYGIYNDLFGKFAYFVPRVHMNIKFNLSNDEFLPVHHGNRVMPEQAKNAPEISFEHKFALSHSDEPEENTMWTLILTNPDGNLTQSDKEYAHWMM